MISYLMFPGGRDTGYSQNRARPFGDRRQFEDAIRIDVPTNKLGKIIGK